MESQYRVRSITEQILDELFLQLKREDEIAPALLAALRKLAKDGRLVDGEQIIRAITSQIGVENEVDYTRYL